MAVAKTGANKNKSTLRIRMLDGNVVVNTLYNGEHGKYFAGTVKGELVLDESGHPENFKNIGELVQA